MRSLMLLATLSAFTAVAMAQTEDANMRSICQMARQICASGGSTCADAAKDASQYHCTGISVSTPSAGPSLAGACPQPADPPQIPDGRHATLSQMISAQHAVKQFNDDLVAYGTCVHKSPGRKDVIATYNAYVDRLKVVADCFNEQVHIFKSSHGGAGSSTPVDCHVQSDDEIAREVQTQVSSAQSTEVADSASPDSTSSETPSSESPAEWQQEHRDKIDELNQEIANHEQQAQQDEADAEQAEAQAQQSASARYSGPGSAFLNLGNAVQGSMNAGLAEKDRQQASDERRQADEEREQLAALGAEQPPVAENDSESIALTRMQTQMIRSGKTIQGALDRQESNIQAGQQTAAEQRSDAREQTEAPGGAGGADATGNIGPEVCPHLSGPNNTDYPDLGRNCNPVRLMTQCVRVLSATFHPDRQIPGFGALDVELENDCGVQIRLEVWGQSNDPDEMNGRFMPGDHYTWVGHQNEYHYGADDGWDCSINANRPGCDQLQPHGHVGAP